jgi:hypothetical protein
VRGQKTQKPVSQLSAVLIDAMTAAEAPTEVGEPPGVRLLINAWWRTKTLGIDIRKRVREH